jgi:glycosyltransferase involved in cell wall biosynthesis
MNELSKMGHEVSMTTLHYNKWFPLSSDVEIISKKTYIDAAYFWEMSRMLKSKRILLNVSMLNKLNSIIQKNDINVATFAQTAYLASWRSLEGSTPFYHMQHFETIFFEDPQMKKFISDTYFLPIYKIANSSWLRDKLLELTGHNFKVVNPAIEHEYFYPRIKEMKKERETVDKINIVALGKGGWKNAVGIYNAVKNVKTSGCNKNIVLHYFGHTPPKSIPFDGKFTVFHKDLSDGDLALLYSDSDIQITFSTAESFPLPPLEAMACGSSVITTPYGTEDYAVNEENALIVEPNNVDMLTQKIKTLVDNEELRNKLRENGIKTAKRYNYKDQAKILELEMKVALDENAKKNMRFKIL